MRVSGPSVPTQSPSSASSLWDALPCVIVEPERPNRVVEYSEPLARLVQRSPEEIVDRPLSDLLRDQEFVEPGRVFSARLAHSLGDLEVIVRSVPWNRAGEPVVLLTMISRPVQKPVSETQELAVQLGDEGAAGVVYRQLVEYASDIIYQVNLEGRVVYANPIARRILGYEDSELGGRRITDLVREDYRAEVDRFYSQQFADRTRSTYLEVPVLTKDGRELWLAQNVQLLVEDGRPVSFQAVAREVTDRKRLEDQLAHLATHDSLTNLFNRAFFEAQLDLKVAHAARYGNSGAVVMIDIDRFKDVNDTFGHGAGDSFLAEFAEFLKTRFRESDVVARLGGDEFAVLLDHVDREGVVRLLADFVERTRRHSTAIGNSSVSTTASVGAALFPEHGSSRESLLGHADEALYQAKNEGRNRFQLFDGPAEDDSGLARGKSTWGDRLRDALLRRDLLLYVQPVRCIKQPSLLYLEALLRLRHPDGKIVDAGAFLDVADRMGLSCDLDRWAFDRGVDWLVEQSGKVDLGVNLSSKSLGNGELLQHMRERIREVDFIAPSLIFEVTESAAINGLAQAREFMGTLSALGCRFALDDFGVGFSSLHRLKQLPVDYLKIDGAFVKNISHDRADRALMRAIVEVAMALGKETIAEFVEDEETLEALRAAGIDHAQGFLLGRAQPIESVLV